MRILKLATACAVLACLASAGAASAQTGRGRAPNLPDVPASQKVEPTKQQFEKGAKDGPTVLAASGVACTPDQFVWHGGGKDKTDPKVDVNAYEVSCKEGLGYVFVQNSNQPKPMAYDCFNAINSPQACYLRGNADPKMGLGMRASTVGRTCAVKDARYIGTSTSTGTAFYELACQAGPGFRLALTGAKVETTECMPLIDSPNECKLTTRVEAASALSPALASSGRTCPLKEARYVGSATSGGETFYEIACTSGPGFMLTVDDKLAFKRAIDCTKAQGIAGGCKLTDVTVAQNEDAALYTRMATKAGYPCQVSKYRFIGTDKQNREVVELACTNRPDGVLALFAETGKSDMYDCVRAGALGQECKLSSAETVYPKYSQALAAKGKATCKVSGARFIGSTDKADYVETACSDGLPGWVLALTPGTETAQELLSCKQAAAQGVQCKLPGNGG
ncbi:hypothetical protein BH09PSE2_BH09PSE2_04400 [soil metagenome]